MCPTKKGLQGLAKEPLWPGLLEHDAKTDALTAYAALGVELFDELLRKHKFKPRRGTAAKTQ